MTTRSSFDRSVTAIIATYNRAQYLPLAIESIVAQRESVGQIIVVDDGSTDDTPARVRQFGSRVDYIRKDNGGKSTAVNLALTKARGEWVWLFDDDDIALPDGTRSLLNALERERAADFAYGGQIIAEEAADGSLTGHRTVLPSVEADDALLLNVLQGFCFRLQAMLIRRTCFERIGNLDERFLRGQDYELMIRLARHFRACRVLEPILIWRQHAGARGPANLTHAAHERDRLWGEFDALLGREIRAGYLLGEFLVPRTTVSNLSSQQRFAALFNRAAVMATKGLLAEFAEDVESASVFAAGAGLTADQRRLILRTGHNARFLARLDSAPDAAAAVLRSLSRRRVPREAVACLARALLYQARHGTPAGHDRAWLLRTAWIFARWAGPGALFRAFT